MEPVVDSSVLPVVATPYGIVFPGVVVTLTLESDEAVAAVTGVIDGNVLVVHKGDNGFAGVGTVAPVEQVGKLPNGQQAAILRGLHRARLGAGWLRSAADCGCRRSGPDRWPADKQPARQLGDRLRAVMSTVAERRHSRRLPEILRAVAEPGGLADAVTSWSDADVDHKLAVIEAIDLEARLELVLAWPRNSKSQNRSVAMSPIRSRGNSVSTSCASSRRHPQRTRRNRR